MATQVAAGLFGVSSFLAVAAVLCALAALWWAFGARGAPLAPAVGPKPEAAPRAAEAVPIVDDDLDDFGLELEDFQKRMEKDCDLALQGLCDSALDDQVVQGLERDFRGQATLCDQFDSEEAAGLQPTLCREELPAFADLDLAGLNFGEFQAGIDQHCDQALENMFDLTIDDNYAMALKNLEVDLAGPDGEAHETMFCLKEVEDAISRQSQEQLVMEASTLCTDAYDAAIEEYHKRLLDLVATADQQTRCVSQLEIIIGRVRRAGALFLLWVI